MHVSKRLPNSEQSWLKFFQMLQHQSKSLALGKDSGSADALVEQIDQLVTDIKSSRGQAVLQSSGVDLSELVKLLNDSKAYIVGLRKPGNHQIFPLDQYLHLKRKFIQMQPSFDDEFQGFNELIFQSCETGAESESLVSDTINYCKRLSHDPRRHIPGLMDVKAQLLSKAQYQGEDSKVLETISERYDSVIRVLQNYYP